MAPVRRRKAAVEQISFEIPAEHAERLRRLEKKEPTDMARDFLIGYYEDKRRTKIELVRISVGWLPVVYAALVKHVGRGGVSHYIRESVYRDAISAGFKLTPIPALKEGHVESASTRRHTKLPVIQPLRQSIVVPLVIPTQWDEVLKSKYPNQVSTYIKAATQLRLERELKKEFPVQRRLGPWLNR